MFPFRLYFENHGSHKGLETVIFSINLHFGEKHFPCQYYQKHLLHHQAMSIAPLIICFRRVDTISPALLCFNEKSDIFLGALIISHQRPQMFAIETLAVSNIAMAVDLPKRRIDYFFFSRTYNHHKCLHKRDLT